MKAARVLRFGPPSVITNDDVPQPEPGAGQLLVRVKAAGVGNWDPLIREGKVELRAGTNGKRLRSIQVTSQAAVVGRRLGALGSGGDRNDRRIPIPSKRSNAKEESCRSQLVT